MNDEKEGVVKKKPGNDVKWEKYLNDQNMSEYERLDAVRREAEIMEEKARMDEMLIRNGRQEDSENVEKTIAVNDMYIEAITAKLKILDQI